MFVDTVEYTIRPVWYTVTRLRNGSVMAGVTHLAGKTRVDFPERENPQMENI